jgi:hypothetical protein
MSRPGRERSETKVTGLKADFAMKNPSPEYGISIDFFTFSRFIQRLMVWRAGRKIAY